VQRNLSGYDARYIALAEAVAASALLTTDRVGEIAGPGRFK
jgi:predicted nucleic acid-binding protein